MEEEDAYYHACDRFKGAEDRGALSTDHSRSALEQNHRAHVTDQREEDAEQPAFEGGREAELIGTKADDKG